MASLPGILRHLGGGSQSNYPHQQDPDLKSKEAEDQGCLLLEPLFSTRRLCSLPPSLLLSQINENFSRALKFTSEPRPEYETQLAILVFEF